MKQKWGVEVFETKKSISSNVQNEIKGTKKLFSKNLFDCFCLLFHSNLNSIQTQILISMIRKATSE